MIRSVNVSQFIRIDDKSKPLAGFWEPLIVGAFINDDTLFIAAYHRINMRQYHFTYKISSDKFLCKPVVSHIKEASILNFPIKAFYSTVTKDCYVFYR